MQGREFRGLAETVTSSYGADPWFFLRELAQNSRDAGARNIWVQADRSPGGEETLSFADDGCGMTLAHARSYLFRLYASDKDGDPQAAGKYGIGFWTILRFQPGSILLQSRRGKECWALEMDAELRLQAVPCRLTRSGTTIFLARPALFPSRSEYLSRLEDELRAYCRYLRRNDRRAGMLPVWFLGKNLTEAMALPGPLSFSFRSGALEGAVGLADKPLVRLYARGLPVWQGAVLSQMSHLQMDADGQSEIGRGLAPVFLLNGNNLDVTFSRNLALENRALDQVRKKAEAALQRLLESSLERTFPRRWHQRLGDRLRVAGKRLRRPARLLPALALLLVIPLEIIVLSRWFPARSAGRSSLFSLQTAPTSYGGASVSLSPSTAAFSFSYHPEKPVWFKLFTADSYDARNGFVRGAPSDRLKAPDPHGPRENVLRMRLHENVGGEMFLPVAVGHVIPAGSVQFAGRRIDALFRTVQGEFIVDVPRGGGTLEYGSCSEQLPPGLTEAEISRQTFLPQGITLPAELEKTVQAARGSPLDERIALARTLVRELVVYDSSAPTAEQYRQSTGSKSWLADVLRIGNGDCDIINGLHVLILRKMGIPSRLVIGLIGEQGQTRPWLHAWSEYFDRAWVTADASAYVEAAAPLPGARGSTGSARDSARPEADQRQRRSSAFSAIALTVLMMTSLALAAILVLGWRRNRLGKLTLPAAEQMKKPLLQIVQHALLQPEAWGEDSPLWSHRLLPIIGGDDISIHQARRLLGRKKLFITGNRNPLALAMAASGITVLDLSQPLVAPVQALLPGAVDADMLCRLRPEPPRDSDLLQAVNALLRGFPGDPPACLLAPGLGSADLLPVALPAPLRNSPFFFPRAFVAVNPAGTVFLHFSALFRRNRELAVYKFLRRLQADHLLDGAAAPALLKKAARRLLKGHP